jgi:hypothetical protein
MTKPPIYPLRRLAVNILTPGSHIYARLVDS